MKRVLSLIALPTLPTLITLITLITLPLPARAEDEAGKYLLLATSRTSTMQKEINDAAEKGYRVVGATRTEGMEVIVVMEQTSETYRYRLLATTRTGTLEKEMNEAAEAGYRAVPRAIGTKRTLGDTMKRSDPNQSATNTEGELLVLMEKGPQRADVIYKVLATHRTGTLQKEMSETAGQGYDLVGLVSRGEHIAIFERAK
jgi:hypothetical protein